MIGFDIGGTKCSICLGEETEKGIIIKDKRVVATDHSISPYKMIDQMCAMAEEMTDNIDVIGISCGGPLNSLTGIIQSPPNLPGWDDVHIVEYLKNKYGAEVYLENDANACAIAEWKFGAGKGCKNMAFLTFGTGMGAGLILNGQLYSGTNGNAGEIGHVRISEYGPVGFGKKGSFEGFCSGNGLAQIGQMIAREKFQSGEPVSFCKDISELAMITAKKIAEYANEGHEDALEVYRICGEKLGHGLSILIDILNPERIVLGSVYQRSEHLLRTSMEKVIERECLVSSKNVCMVVPAKLEENIGDYAALGVGIIGGQKDVL
ncbi:MAG: ROK family protein [Tyzzerella sp.]|nr:ROK family protein [Tyzzerella sp.]